MAELTIVHSNPQTGLVELSDGRLVTREEAIRLGLIIPSPPVLIDPPPVPQPPAPFVPPVIVARRAAPPPTPINPDNEFAGVTIDGQNPITAGRLNQPLTRGELQSILESESGITTSIDEASVDVRYGFPIPQPRDPEFVQRAADEFAGGNRQGGEFDNGPLTSNSQDAVNGGTESQGVSVGTPKTATSSTGSSQSFSTPPESITIDPRANELDNYSNYTYNLALYMLTPKTYVRLMQQPRSFAQLPKFLVCSSGGIGNDPDRASEFDVDFFIDNLKVVNVSASPTRMAGNTNAVDISFDIIEPRGVTLLDRLKAQAKQSLEEEQNYITTPYVLEIKFKGYDEEGRPSDKLVAPKYIPIRIVELKFSVDSSGATYKASAMPYNHDVLNSVRQTIPINVQVKANTVGDIFSNSSQTFNEQPDFDIPLDDVFTDFSGAGESDTPGTKFTVTGDSRNFASAINTYYTSLTKPRRVSQQENDRTSASNTTARTEAETELADEYEFVLHPDIANARLVLDRFDPQNTPAETDKLSKTYSQAVRNKVKVDKDKQIIRINSGTSIVNLISHIIVSSAYVNRNIIDEIGASTDPNVKTNQPIRWFKVKPKIIDCKGWDKKAGRYAFKIRYDILPHDIYYSDFPFAAKSMPKGNGVHKIYDYIFSGLNTNVTNFALDFDTAYYQAHTIGTGYPDSSKTHDNIAAPQSKFLPKSSEGENLKSDKTIADKRSKDLMTSIMNDGTDLINLKLDIVGDPAFIPTGDAFWQDKELRKEMYATAFLPDGTINYDISPPYIQVNLKTPVDYDDLTGLADPNKVGKYSTSDFTGVYQITEITNTFSGGIFSQKLDGFRTHMQPVGGRVARSRESDAGVQRAALQKEIQNVILGGIFASFAQQIQNSGQARLINVAEASVTGGILPKLGNEINQTIDTMGNQLTTLAERTANQAITTVFNSVRDLDIFDRFEANSRRTQQFDPNIDLEV